MGIILSTITNYLSIRAPSQVILEGTSGSGKTTLAKELMTEYYYFKSIGVPSEDGINYDPSILKNYRIVDRYKPISSYIYFSDLSPRLLNYSYINIEKFTKKYMLDNVLFVFLLHSRYINSSSIRGRNWIIDPNSYNNIDNQRRKYLDLIAYLKGKYDMLVVDKNEFQYMEKENEYIND